MYEPSPVSATIVLSGAASLAPIAAPPFQPSDPPPLAKIDPGRLMPRWSKIAG